jgi:hypothetical protein
MAIIAECFNPRVRAPRACLRVRLQKVCGRRHSLEQPLAAQRNSGGSGRNGARGKPIRSGMYSRRDFTALFSSWPFWQAAGNFAPDC